jgi:hypothetical protein
LIRFLVLLILALLFAVVGYVFFAIVVAIYTGLLLHGEKMYYAQGLAAQLFGGTGALLGVALAGLIWRLGIALLGGAPRGGAPWRQKVQ